MIQPGGAALEAFNIAAWNGSAWSALGEGLDDTVYALAIDADGGLVAGGAFGYNGPGQMVLNYVARWDGAAWNGMSVGMDADVLALAVASDGTLYAGGAFTAADGAANAAHLARWTGSAWEGLSADALIDNTVRTLAVDDAGMLYAGGDFTSVTNNLVAGYVVGWDGAQWVFLGGAQSNGVTGCCVTSLAVASDGAVIVGGSFEGANRPVGPPVAVAGLASYAGGAWEALASGIDGSPAAMAVNGADLYVGGAFRVAGGFASSHLGRWSVNVSYVSTEDGEPALPETHALSAVYPNPFNPTAHFSLNIRETQDVRVDVYDMLGRRIAQLYQGVMTGGVTHEFALEAGAWRSGTYLIRVTGAGFTDTRSVVLLK
ncbi:MAG: T9SS type A sorting domain-containing protein [Rhodothermales bacterium]